MNNADASHSAQDNAKRRGVVETFSVSPAVGSDPTRATYKGDEVQDVGVVSQHQTLDQSPTVPNDVAAAASSRTLRTDTSEMDENGAPSSSEPPERPPWNMSFHMVIHLAGDDNGMRVARLDTGASVNVISLRVVKSLHLPTEQYQGRPLIFALKDTYLPDQQVICDWHVAKFYKTYTSTFVVVDEDHSGDFDILLGMKSIEDIGFYQVDSTIWFPTANGVPLSSSVGASRREQDPKSGREKQADTQGLMSAHQDQPLGPTPGTIHEFTPMAVKQAPAVADPERRLMRAFQMVIHLADNNHALRVARLDTDTVFNYIGGDIVNSLALNKEPKQGHLYKLVGRSYLPHWQVRFDWHVAESYKTYTSTFEVLDGAHSGDFDILLGRGTINKAEFDVVGLDKDWETPSSRWGSTPAFPPDLAAITAGVDEDSDTPSLTDGSTLSTSGSTEEVREAAEAIAELLMADDVLGPLYKKALAVLKIDDLEKRFGKLLKACATELRTEASNNIQQSASQFLWRRVRYVVNHMGTCLDPQRKEKAQRLQELASEEPNKRAQVEGYIYDGAVGPDVQKPDAVSDSGSSEQDAPENPYSLPREQVKSFILNSVALVNLRNKFSQFVLQRQSQGGDFIGTLPDSPSAARVTQGEPVPLEPNLAADGITDGSDVSPGSLNVAEREHPYAEDETRPREHFLWDILQRHAYLSRCIEIVLQVAEFLELRERMLEPGFKRVRWTCVCGALLYDDFRTESPSSLARLQQMLDSPKGIYRSAANGPSVQEGTQPAGASLAAGPYVRGQQSTTTTSGLHSEDENNTVCRQQQSEGLRHRRYNNTTINISSTWILPIYHSERYMTKVEHLSVNIDMSDTALFVLIKQRYHKSRSMIRRLLAMRGVKKISFVKFMHAPREPDIRQPDKPSDNWPPKERCPPWDYEGCQSGELPQIGANYLLHQWRNPSHSDAVTYHSHPRSLVERLLFKLRTIRNSDVGVPANIPMTTTSRSEIEHDREPVPDEEAVPTRGTINPGDKQGLQTPDRSRYVFLRIPKKLGEQLVPHDRATPEAWGLYFEEGFLLHHLFLIILSIYIMATVAFAAYWCTEYGFVGPNSGAAAFGVSSWMIGLLSLVTTVMFKWAE